MAEKIHAPWTQREFDALSAHQRDERRHPLTCPDHSDKPLTVYRGGLVCWERGCEYTQTWAPAVAPSLRRETRPASDEPLAP